MNVLPKSHKNSFTKERQTHTQGNAAVNQEVCTLFLKISLLADGKMNKQREQTVRELVGMEESLLLLSTLAFLW